MVSNDRLAAVLACATETDASLWRDVEVLIESDGVRRHPFGEEGWGHIATPWANVSATRGAFERAMTPADLVEALTARGLWPFDDAEFRRFPWSPVTPAPIVHAVAVGLKMRSGAGRPTTAPLLGSAYYDIETGIVYAADGNAWVELAAAPTQSLLADVIALAAQDPSALLAAEAMAGECAKRLAPWNVAGMKRIVWRVGTVKTNAHPTGWPVAGNDDRESPDTVSPEAWWANIGNVDADVAPWWANHVAAWPADEGRACPHDPVLRILRAGFALDAVGETCVLVCPPIA